MKTILSSQWKRVALAAALLSVSVARGEVMLYPIAEFEEAILKPPTTKVVWVEGGYHQEWIPATTASVWVPATTKQVWVPATTKQVWVPTTYREQWVATTYRDVVHEPQSGVTHYDEVGHTEYIGPSTSTVSYPAEYRTVEDPAYTKTYWVPDWVELFGVVGWHLEYDWEIGDWYVVYDLGYYWEDWGHEVTETVPASSHQEMTRAAREETITIEGRFVWVVDVPERNEPWYTPGYVEQVVDAAGHYTTVVDREGHHEEVEVPDRWDEEPVPGFWDIVAVPGRWVDVEEYGHEETINLPARWETEVIPPSTLAVYTDGQNITAVSWQTQSDFSLPWNGAARMQERNPEVPGWVHAFLNDPGWSLDEPVEDDIDDSTMNEALAWSFVDSLSDELKKPANLRRLKVRRQGGTGGLRIIEEEGRLNDEGAMAIVVVYILSAAQQLSTKRAVPELYFYICYEKIGPADESPRRVYTGRTFGRGDDAESAASVLDRREARHQAEGRRPLYSPPIPNTLIITYGLATSAWAATRGREQQVMDYHNYHDQLSPDPDSPLYAFDRSHSENARPSADRPRGTRGVARENKNGFDYWTICNWAFEGWVWDFTGYARVPSAFPYSWPPPNLVLTPLQRPPLAYTYSSP